MIIILHGDNIPKSRDVILQVKQKIDLKIPKDGMITNKKEVSVGDTSPEQLLDLANSFGLFDDPPFIIFDITGAGRKNMKPYIEVIEKFSSQVTLIILSGKELSNKNAFIKNKNNLGAKIITSTDIPKENIFKFVDALFEKNKKLTYKRLQNLLQEGNDPIYLLSMIAYGLRNIAYCTFDSNEYSKLSPFIKKKVKSQAKNFSKQDIASIYTELYYLDKNIKLGKVSPDICIPLIVEKVT